PYQKTRYPEASDPAQAGPKPSDAARLDAKRHRALGGEELHANDVEALKTVIADGQPIAYAIPVFESWYDGPKTRDDGFITLPVGADDPVVGGHAITLVGFGVD